MGWAHCVSIWWWTPHIGHLWIDQPPRDLIKDTLAGGLIWELCVVRCLLPHVVPGSVALDVGDLHQHPCHPDGALSRVGGPRLRRDPQRKAYRELRPNIDLNGLANVTALRYAVGTESRIVEMNLSKEANPLALTVKGEWDKTGRIQGFGG